MLSFESVLVDIEYDHKKKDIDFFQTTFSY